MTDLDLTFVDEAVARIGGDQGHLIALLQAIQEHYRYLPEEAIRRLSRATGLRAADITGVSTFYSQFRHEPVGRHRVKVCVGTACHVKGAHNVLDACRRRLHLPAGHDTDSDGLFTVEEVACLGCCTLAPVVQIDEVTFGRTSPDGVARMLEEFLALRRSGPRKTRAGRASGAAGEIRVGRGSCCAASGSGEVFNAVRDAVIDLGAAVTVKTVGCVGMCHRVPLVEVVPEGKASALYAKVRPEDARAIVRRHFRPRGLVRRLGDALARGLDSILIGPDSPSPDRCAIDVRDAPVADFLGRQRRLATEGCGLMDPMDLDEYLASGGFEALRSCLAGAGPESVIERIAASGLRGRGGAGFPTARKWAAVRDQPAPGKVVICNGDEGDPGAFMDRMILESFPYRVIEGMAVAAYAVGAAEGVFYIRAEYPLAVRRVSEALDRCRQRGLLGGDGWSLDLRIMRGAGAFVCGEETALIASIEGRRGMPRLRPPFPAESGLGGRPTLVNNVETYALVPWILRNGPEAFAAIGSGGGRGTKVFALAGKVARGGLIEVPLGATIRQIVEDIGGGIAGGSSGKKAFKAVQVGGPSGGCIPAALADTPVDFEALTAAGAMMGSGGLVVLDESDCMVDITRYFLQFTQNQSCGKCTFCRIGTRRMLDILERICAGAGHHSDLPALETLARQTKASSLCGLGKTAPNPVLSTLRYFRDEYEAYLKGRCPAGVCKKLITYSITDDCIGCTLCAQHCPVGAIDPKPYEKHVIDETKCIRCNTCRAVCPAGAVKVE